MNKINTRAPANTNHPLSDEMKLVVTSHECFTAHNGGLRKLVVCSVGAVKFGNYFTRVIGLRASREVCEQTIDCAHTSSYHANH